jgi:hypothetical protein
MREELGNAVALFFGLPLLACIGIFLLIEFVAFLCGGRLPWWPKDERTIKDDIKGFFTE